MNSYHEDYHEMLKQKQKEILSQSPNESVCIMQMANLIPKNPKYQFIPSLCGLSIPLNITGHTLTITLALLAFILSLISNLVNNDH